MWASARTAVILGATGATGSRLLPMLLADERYDRIVTLTRRPPVLNHPKLLNRVVDFDRLMDALHDLRADDAYCTFGTTIKKAGSSAAMTRIDHDYVMAFAQAAFTAGVARFAYLSAANAKADSTIYYSRLKGTTENALKAMMFPNLTIFRPGMILAERKDRRWAESLLFPILPLLDKAMVGSLRKYRSIPVETLARAIVALGCPPESEGIRTYYWQDMVTSITTAQREGNESST